MKTKSLFFFLLTWLTLAPGMLFSQGHYLTTPFQKVESIPDGKALIYLYRPKNYTGSAVHYAVNLNGEALFPHLYNGSYMVLFVDPGKQEFYAEVAKQYTAVVVEAEAGQTYFVRGSVVSGVWVGGPKLELAPEILAMKEIGKCKLLKTEK